MSHFIKATMTATAAAWTLLCSMHVSAAEEKASLKSSFPQSEASECAAVYGWIMTNLVPNGLPQSQARQIEVAFMVWQYEMVAATPNANDDALRIAAQKAQAALNKGMPVVKKGEPADNVVQYVLKKENGCGQKMKTAYPDNNHPVIAQLRVNAAKIENSAAKSVKKNKLQ